MSKTSKEVVGLDVAEAELGRMLDSLDYEPDEDEKASFVEIKKNLVRAISTGHMIVDEDGLPTITLKFPAGAITHLTFKRPTGAIIMSLSGSKEDPAVVNRALADLTGQPTAIISKLDYRTDYKLAGKVMQVFLS